MNYSTSTKDVANKYAFSKEVMRFYLCVYDLENTQIFFCYSTAVLIHKPTGLILGVMPMYTYTYAYMCLIICTQINIHVYRDSIYIRWDLNVRSLFSEILQMVCQESCGG